MRYVNDALSIGVDFDYLWPIAPSGSAASPPNAFANGVLFDDPMRATIEASSDPDALLQTLVAAGYAAARLTPEIADISHECDEYEVFELVAEGIELELLMESGHEGEGIKALQSNLQALECIDFCYDADFIIAGPFCTGCTTTGWTPCTGSCPGSYNSPVLDPSMCAVMCWYWTTLSCSWTKWMMTINWDCSSCVWTRTGTSTETLYRKCTYLVEPPCPALPPAGFTCAGSCSAPDNSTVDCSDPLSHPGNWTGTSPCD